VLPVVSVALMFVQQQMYMPPPTDDVQRQQQTMMKFMTVFMGVMFYKVAAGVCIYFIVSSAWGFAERSLLPKPKKPGDPDESAPRTGGSATTASPPPGGRGGPAAPSQERKSFSKKARQQRKQDRAREQEKTDAAADTFVGKLKAWWERVLEEARKK
jgi:YidC/Oxa1 family membrane protein insertase